MFILPSSSFPYKCLFQVGREKNKQCVWIRENKHSHEARDVSRISRKVSFCNALYDKETLSLYHANDVVVDEQTQVRFGVNVF